VRDHEFLEAPGLQQIISNEARILEIRSFPIFARRESADETEARFKQVFNGHE
jgi:hypothetical protein